MHCVKLFLFFSFLFPTPFYQLCWLILGLGFEKEKERNFYLLSPRHECFYGLIKTLLSHTFSKWKSSNFLASIDFACLFQTFVSSVYCFSNAADISVKVFRYFVISGKQYLWLAHTIMMSQSHGHMAPISNFLCSFQQTVNAEVSRKLSVVTM